MSNSRNRNKANSSRRDFLKTAAGVAAGAAFTRIPLGAQGARGTHPFPGIDPKLLMTPDQAWEWAAFKAQCGPTYAGSAGWKRFTDFLISKSAEFGAVDLDSVDIPYDHYIVDDWPDRRTHIHDSRNRRREARHRRNAGAGRRLVRHDVGLHAARGHHGADALLRSGASAGGGSRSPARSSSSRRRSSRRRRTTTTSSTTTRSPTTSGVRPASGRRCSRRRRARDERPFTARWVWSQLGRFAADRPQGARRGIVIVYDLSPGAAFGLTQRSVYTETGRAGLGASYINCPTLTLDRVNGAKVLADAKAGKMATLTLTRALPARHGQGDHRVSAGQELRHAAGRAGAARRRTPTRCRSIEENGGFGHARHHAVLQPAYRKRAARAHARLLLRLPALHAGRRSRAGRSTTTTISIRSS